MIDYRTKWLQPLEAKGRLRALTAVGGVDFTSNDYLGMAAHPRLYAAAHAALDSGMAIGSGGSRLLRGQHEAHARLEEYAARHFGAEKALYFANGFMANLALLTALPDRHDVVVVDEWVHASMREALQAGTAQKIKVPHNDLDAFADALRRSARPGRQLWLAVESLYSMDGDCAPLAQLLDLAHIHDAILIVDEAHATGIYGPSGRGLTEGMGYENLIAMHTCGKALGVAGGLVCGAAAMVETLINRARAFIYTTAPMPLQAHLVMTAMDILEDEPFRREELLALVRYAHGVLPPSASRSQIVPVIVSEDAEAVRLASLLQQNGMDVRAIRPPTVPEGTARLRLSLNNGLSRKNIDDLAAVLEGARQRQAL